ncbi:MAG: hypothetical protein ACTSVB_07890 [Candidatus Heimdallarchaeaceae archaeon]
MKLTKEDKKDLKILLEMLSYAEPDMLNWEMVQAKAKIYKSKL